MMDMKAHDAGLEVLGRGTGVPDSLKALADIIEHDKAGDIPDSTIVVLGQLLLDNRSQNAAISAARPASRAANGFDQHKRDIGLAVITGRLGGATPNPHLLRLIGAIRATGAAAQVTTDAIAEAIGYLDGEFEIAEMVLADRTQLRREHAELRGELTETREALADWKAKADKAQAESADVNKWKGEVIAAADVRVAEERNNAQSMETAAHGALERALDAERAADELRKVIALALEVISGLPLALHVQDRTGRLSELVLRLAVLGEDS